MMKEKTNRKKRISCLLVAMIMLAAGAFTVIWSTDEIMAEQTTEDDPIVMQNEEGQEVIIDVEEELAAGSEELEAQNSAAGVENVDEDEVPLAGFSEVDQTAGSGNIHLVWMVLLFAAALAYIIYFSRFQNKIFELRRQIADAEIKLRKGADQ